jgi:hypothetical protein
VDEITTPPPRDSTIQKMPVKVTSFVNKVKKKLTASTKTKMDEAKKKL